MFCVPSPDAELDRCVDAGLRDTRVRDTTAPWLGQPSIEHLDLIRGTVRCLWRPDVPLSAMSPPTDWTDSTDPAAWRPCRDRVDPGYPPRRTWTRFGPHGERLNSPCSAIAATALKADGARRCTPPLTGRVLPAGRRRRGPSRRRSHHGAAASARKHRFTGPPAPTMSTCCRADDGAALRPGRSIGTPLTTRSVTAVGVAQLSSSVAPRSMRLAGRGAGMLVRSRAALRDSARGRFDNAFWASLHGGAASSGTAPGAGLTSASPYCANGQMARGATGGHRRIPRPAASAPGRCFDRPTSGAVAGGPWCCIGGVGGDPALAPRRGARRRRCADREPAPAEREAGVTCR